MIAPLLLAPVLALLASAQEAPTPDEIHGYVDLMLVELAEGKVDLISEVMQLDDDQAMTFWNLYQEYEIELFQLGDRRLSLQEEFRGALQGDGLDDALATDIAARFFVLKRDRAELIESYHRTFTEQLSPIAAAQFVQLESRFNLVIDLLFAADTPLMSAPLDLDGSGAPVAGEFSREQEPGDESDADAPPEQRSLLMLCAVLALLSLGLLVAYVRKS
jgi:hypothetical protein